MQSHMSVTWAAAIAENDEMLFVIFPEMLTPPLCFIPPLGKGSKFIHVEKLQSESFSSFFLSILFFSLPDQTPSLSLSVLQSFLFTYFLMSRMPRALAILTHLFFLSPPPFYLFLDDSLIQPGPQPKPGLK